MIKKYLADVKFERASHETQKLNRENWLKKLRFRVFLTMKPLYHCLICEREKLVFWIKNSISSLGSLLLLPLPPILLPLTLTFWKREREYLEELLNGVEMYERSAAKRLNVIQISIQTLAQLHCYCNVTLGAKMYPANIPVEDRSCLACRRILSARNSAESCVWFPI